MEFFTNAGSLADVFSTKHLLVYFIMSVLNSLLLLSISYKFLQIMQQSGYEGFGYFKWLRRRDNIYNVRLAILTMLSFLAFLTFNIAFAFAEGAWIFYAGFIFYVVFLAVYYVAEKTRKKKIPIVFTARMNRLILTYFLFMILLTFAVVCLFNFLAFIGRENTLFVRVRFAPICLMPIAIPIFVLVANFINRPYEKLVQKSYVKKCKAKLASRKDLIKIGITGSYGKTTVKKFLCTILEEKYKVLATPASYNTPMGICKAVNHLKDDHQVFIAEMGARRVGDIKELTNIVDPNYAIINGITNQHIETFGSINEIKQAKYELVENMQGGVVAYTVDSENTVEMFNDCPIRCIPAGLNARNNPRVYATNVKCDENGSDFTLVIYGKEIKCHTNLYGKHSISNLCLASAIAYELGLSISEISAGISRLTMVEHRLSITKNDRGIIILDDSYNSNPSGFDSALEVLSYFKGRKIVVTPGMVEQGVMEDLENYQIGKKLAKVCDLAVLVGRTAAFMISSGLVENGFAPQNIIKASSLDQAMKKLSEVLKEGDVILFENDLPDKFD